MRICATFYLIAIAILGLCPQASAQERSDTHLYRVVVQSEDLPQAERQQIVESVSRRECTSGEVPTAVLLKVRDLGYFQAVINELPRRDEDDRAKTPLITVAVHAGVKYHLDQLSISGATIFARSQLGKEFLIDHGGVFSPTLISTSLEGMRALYATEGYIDTVIAPMLRVDSKKHTVDLTLNVQEGVPYSFGTLRLNGVEPQPDAAKSLLQSWQALQGLRFDTSRIDQWLMINRASCPGCTRAVNLSITRQNVESNLAAVTLTFPEFRYR